MLVHLLTLTLIEKFSKPSPSYNVSLSTNKNNNHNNQYPKTTTSEIQHHIKATTLLHSLCKLYSYRHHKTFTTHTLYYHTLNFKFLTRNLNGFNIWLLGLFLRDNDNENPIFHGSLNLIHPHILRKSKPSHELATTTFHAMPFVVLVFFLYIPFSTDLENSVILNLNLHFLLQPWYIYLEYLYLWGFLLVNSSAY